MIGSLKGLVRKLDDRLISVNVSGVGLEVNVLPETALTVKDGVMAEFHTHLAVREDALELFGFLTGAERELFRHLISVSGIGPRAAMAILALAPPATLRRAIASGDAAYLTKVSGIGRKRAEKIVLELKDKLEADGSNEENAPAGEDADLLDALRALGWTPNEARKVTQALPPELMGTKERLREALRRLQH